MKKGKVYLIGAGPGDPELLTLRGKRCIEEADIIIYDYLVSPEILSHASPEAKLIYAGKRGGNSSSQKKINELLIKEAGRGKTVARLKGGDPFIFGRGGEEAEELVQAGLDFEVVPGVSSAIAVPAYAGIPLTHRDYTSTVAFITGQEDPTKGHSSIAWEKISTGVGTLVVLMGVGKLAENVQMLLDNGRSPRTPAALIRWGTTAEQETLVGELNNIVKLSEERQFQPPAVLVVGGVVRLRETLNWFEKKPLFGRRIVVTRAREQAGSFAEILRKYGAEPIEFPSIEIKPPQNWRAVDPVIKNLGSYHWIIFTSINGVKYFTERLKAKGRDIRDLKGVRVCAIGPGTAKGMENLGINVDFVPKQYRTEAIAEGLGKRIRGKRVLLVRVQGMRDSLPRELKGQGARLQVVGVYRTLSPAKPARELRKLLSEGKIDMITFGSSSAVKNFFGMLGDRGLKKLLKGVAIASIGPKTTETIRKAGIDVDVMPAEYTIPALSEAIVDYYGE
ncbi:MAG: uroporphyrinogen-III C-methyltransferase [Deltaproteobacteria bacterium]|nr:MAG: uroporphyrinogen-III C-methyltransferase [Deltaproteobacteria bacterium]